MGLKLPRAMLNRLLVRTAAAANDADGTPRKLASRDDARPSNGGRAGHPPVSAATSVSVGAASVSLQFPLVVVSEPNRRDHWAAKHRRASAQRNVVVAFELLRVRADMARLCGLPLERRVRVTLVRLGTRPIDAHDNLRTAFKPIVDEVARFLGVDDADPRIVWAFAQDPDGRRKLADCRVRITFEVLETTVMDGPRKEGRHAKRD